MESKKNNNKYQRLTIIPKKYQARPIVSRVIFGLLGFNNRSTAERLVCIFLAINAINHCEKGSIEVSADIFSKNSI